MGSILIFRREPGHISVVGIARADMGNLQPQLAHRHPARLHLDAAGSGPASPQVAAPPMDKPW
ncbi:hypothetical protein Mth01_42510 [Sphaerimonospora thailandensis]|uniref:Uncharacterized protein n=1 Tax=Sphaerimonospora thailandensis TaxID=795644 RepID=A0A8J3RGM0_9ACTN|nr:hypothetical protein Mth01_42510 [Sphaerimonospora thailandensis]